MKALIPFFLLVCLAGGGRLPNKYFYVDLELTSKELLGELTAAGFDIGGVNLENNTVSIIVGEGDLRLLGRYSILSKREGTLGPDPLFQNPSEVETFLKTVEKNFPTLARTRSIGRSIEGRELYAMELTNRDITSSKKAILFDAMHHAREVMTTEVALDIIDYLTKNYATDPKVQKWMDSYSIWVVPMVNPDGNNKVWNASSMWRKNARGGYGVDNNRNYPTDWDTCNGSSGSTSSETYRGTAPASEPETKALMDLAGEIKPVMGISYHSYSELVIYPYGCDPKVIPDPDRAVYEKLGKDLAKTLVRDSGTGTYTPGTPYELLYNVDGGSVDYMYEVHRMMSFVVEVNSSSQGFQPSFSAWREKTVKLQRAGWQFLLERMKDTVLPSKPIQTH